MDIDFAALGWVDLFDMDVPCFLASPVKTGGGAAEVEPSVPGRVVPAGAVTEATGAPGAGTPVAARAAPPPMMAMAVTVASTLAPR